MAKNFIERLSIQQEDELCTEMRIHTRENPKLLNRFFDNGKLHVIHGKNNNKETIESIFCEFEIEKIYNCIPSQYDQKRFQNFMLYDVYANDKEYKQKLEEFKKKKEEEENQI